MKKVISLLSVALMMACFATEASAQGFLKKLSKAASSVTEKVTGSSDSEAGADTISSEQKDLLLKDVPAYTVSKVIETAENGDTLKNEDGTVRYHYLVMDKDGKTCDATVAQSMVNSRLKAYGKIIAKIGGGAAMGAVGGLLSGNKKDALTGAAVGAAAGLAFSAGDISQIRKLNKSLKELKSTLEAYQNTFTEEGLPKDASADLTNVDGIDFTKGETITKPAADVMAEMAASKEQEIPSLDDLKI